MCDTAGMDVSLALLADAANTSRDGKLNLLGIFDAIQAPKFPTTHPSMTLVLRLEASAADGNRAHDLDVRFIDADGARLFKIDARVVVPPGMEPGQPHQFTHPIQINGLALKRPGQYAFEVRMDGVLAATVPLRALQSRVGQAGTEGARGPE